MRLIGNVDKITRSYVAGWVADSDDPGRAVDVLVYTNGKGRGRVTADRVREDLRGVFPGATGSYGFRFEFGWPLSPFRINEVEVVEAGERHPLQGGQRTLASQGGLQEIGSTPIFVTSTGRAGTSLLMGQLATHPEIAVAGSHPYEVKQLTYYAAALRTLSLEANWDRSVNPDALLSDASRYAIGFNPFHDPQFGTDPLLDKYWEVTGCKILTSAFRDMVVEYYEAIRAMTNKLHTRYFAEKAHPSPLIRDGVVAMFGGLREILLVRDPRDLVCSYRAFWGANPADAISLIRSQFEEIASRVSAAGSDTLLMRYEDLVLQPVETLCSVYTFLEINQKAPNANDTVIFRKHGTSKSPAESIGRWRQELTSEERVVCERGFAALLPILGYDANE
jgi:Sulfotransferase family